MLASIFSNQTHFMIIMLHGLRGKERDRPSAISFLMKVAGPSFFVCGAARVQSNPARGKPTGATVPNANGRPRTFRGSLYPPFPTQPSFSGRTAAQPDGSGAAAGTGGSA